MPTALAHLLAGWPSSLLLKFSTELSQLTLSFFGLVEHVLRLSPVLKNDPLPVLRTPVFILLLM